MKTKIILMVLSILAVTGCKTIQYIPVETIRSEYVDKYSRDSIMVRDSIYINRWQQSDTVYLYEYRDRLLYRDVLKVDSIIKVDSIPYPVKVEIEKIVFKKTWYDNIMIYGFWILFLLLILKFGLNWVKNRVIPFI